ncbi:MAG: transglycosylase domain-containing protein, partial [Clostridia bacterium]|nr:transglycosylase domain-containing protein [Clostridia bacterium]
YLNTIYLGRGVYGVSQAAKTYFGKELSELTLGECAAIAGITKNPYKYDLIRFPEQNAERRALVLKMMYENGNISEFEYDRARAEDVRAIRSSNKSSDFAYNSYFTDALINQLIDDLMDEKGYSRAFASRLIYGGGLKIMSTQDPAIQAKMDEVFQDEENFPGKMGSDGTYPQASMVLMDPYTGYVKALYGGRGKKQASLVLNRATATTRQPGSCIKPITVYAPAIEEKIVTPISVVDDAPKDFNVRSTGWPNNENRTYSGLCTIYRGIGSSLNTVAVDLIQKLGYQKSFDFATQKMGMSTLVDKVVKTASDGTQTVSSDIGASPLALGGLTNGVTVYDMTAAYCAFVNDGNYTTPVLYTVVYDSTGNVLLDNTPETTEAMSQKTRDYMIQLLRYVVTNGTGRKAALGNIEVGGKTGTTSADNDRWFAGITPYYAGVVWFGYDKPQSLQKFSTNPALQLWHDVMKKVHEDLPAKKFELKTKMVQVSYCQDSGLVPTDLCKADIRGSRVLTAMVAPEDAPKKSCDVHAAILYDTKTKQLANENCPTGDVKTAAALNLRRLYPYYGVKVGDQQYCIPYYVSDDELKKGLYKSASATLQYCAAHPGEALKEIKKPEEKPKPEETPPASPTSITDIPEVKPPTAEANKPAN